MSLIHTLSVHVYTYSDGLCRVHLVETVRKAGGHWQEQLPHILEVWSGPAGDAPDIVARLTARCVLDQLA